MSASSKAKQKRPPKKRAMRVQAEEDETEAQTMARAFMAPYMRHGILADGIATRMASTLPGEPQFFDYGDMIKARAGRTAQGDMATASEMLTAQALSLDAIFTECARRSTLNMGDYIDASERYMRLALKAQSNCRATLDSLAKLHQPREQTVRHVHVNEGGQAVVADQFHHHAGGQGKAKNDEQTHATGTGAAGSSPALPGQDPQGNGVPIPGSEGEEALPNARRDKSRSTKG